MNKNCCDIIVLSHKRKEERCVATWKLKSESSSAKHTGRLAITTKACLTVVALRDLDATMASCNIARLFAGTSIVAIVAWSTCRWSKHASFTKLTWLVDLSQIWSTQPTAWPSPWVATTFGQPTHSWIKFTLMSRTIIGRPPTYNQRTQAQA